MCGRFFVDGANPEIKEYVARLPQDSPQVKLGAVFPQETALILGKGQGQAQPLAMRWGLPRLDGKGLIINARLETASVRPMFRRGFRNHPIIIPVSGFYEWKSAPPKKEKYFFRPMEGNLLYLAGFWENCKVPDFPPEERFVILTTNADEIVGPVHERMPVLIPSQEIPSWLAGAWPENSAPCAQSLTARLCSE